MKTPKNQSAPSPNQIVLEHNIRQILKKVTAEKELNNVEKVELVANCLSVAAAFNNDHQLTVAPGFLGGLSDEESKAIVSFMSLGVLAQMVNN